MYYMQKEKQSNVKNQLKMIQVRSLMLLQLGRMKYIDDFKMVTLTEILSTTSPISVSKTIRCRRH